MKKVFIFIGGMVTGAILMVIISALMVGTNLSNNGVTMFEDEGDCISENSFKVFQVLDSGDALATEIEGEYSIPTGLTVLLLSEDGKSYYDEQVVEVLSGKCVKQVGIFKYTTNAGSEKTVPVVIISDK